MTGKRVQRFILPGLFLLTVALVLAVAYFFPLTTAVRSKSAALPLTDTLTPQQVLAQDLALSDKRVQAYTLGSRTEVMGVHPVLADQYTAVSQACATADCRQVDIYNFDQDAAVQALVNLDSRTVLDVLYLPQIHPGINKRLRDLAVHLAVTAPEVIEVLGFQPTAVDMAPVESDLPGSSCDEGHLCAGATFQLEDRVLWAIIDLTDEKLAGLDWTLIDPDVPTYETFVPTGCPASGSVNRDGWTMDYAVTGSDGLRVYNVAYEGTAVLTSVKLAEWHVDYGTTGFRDATGCAPTGGFPIMPYGETQVLDLLDGEANVMGFEVVQDFRMANWGANCNYRYEQRIRFFLDGRFRVVSGAYGRGCGTNSFYRPLVRIDIAVNGDDNDNFARWNGSSWDTLTTENYLVPYAEAGHGPHESTSDGYSWRITDATGEGYFIEQDVGQFDGESGRGDAPFLYATLHHPEEGDTDLGGVGECCFDDHRHGPENFVDGESISNANLVLWYIPQSDTVAAPPDQYCWTVSGEPTPETYPCRSGPLFVPIPTAPLANFDYSQPVLVSETVVFTNTSTGLPPITYSWDFGDGITTTLPHPTHIYTMPGTYTVTLLAVNELGSGQVTQLLNVMPPPQEIWLPFIYRP